MDKQTVTIICIVLMSLGLGYVAEMYFKKDIVSKLQMAWVGIFAIYVIFVNVISLFQ